ncbi:MAG: DsbA family oxidoreductase [Actinomycetes bacterium]
MSKMKVEIWSDIACPFCWIGKRSFDSALARFEHADETEVIWRSYQLGPNMPREMEGDIYDVLAAKYGGTREQAKEMNVRVRTMAEGVGLDCNFDAIRPTNTMDAHRLIHLARKSGVQDETKELLFKAYFHDGSNVSDIGVLRRTGAEVGLDTTEVAEMLDTGDFAVAVGLEQNEAQELGISAVPTFVFDRKSAVAGAQSEDLLLDALRTAWAAEPR